MGLPNNSSVLNVRPTMGRVYADKSANGNVLDIRPNNTILNFPIKKIITRTLSSGQPMGLLLDLTYPTTQVVMT